MIADLSTHHVAITTGFTGAEVLLFGSIDGSGDIIVTVTGPLETVVVRQKERFAGVWANSQNVIFKDVPNFYAIASTQSLLKITTMDILKRLQIGPDYLEFKVSNNSQDTSTDDLRRFSDALKRNKKKENLYTKSSKPVFFVKEKLFRTKIYLPANMATGDYRANVYLFQNGKLLKRVSTPMLVEKVGFGADVYHFAHQKSALYGIAAIIIAISAGWLAAVLFRKA